MQDELFRLASLGLEEACNQLNVEVPPWMQGLLGRGKDDGWDDLAYRTSVKLLLRYGLVRLVREPWKGTTMHSLVQWRAGVGMDREEYWRLYLTFIAAVCIDVGDETDRVRSRRHVVVHLPPNERLISEISGVEEEGLWWMWLRVGHVLWEEGRWKEGRWKEAEDLDAKVLEARRRVLGEEHPDTITAMANLASTYRDQGRWKEAGELFVKVLEASRSVLGEEHPYTIRAMANLAHTKRDLGQNDVAFDLMTQSATASSRVSGDDHPDCRSRHEQVALWSSATSDDDRDDDLDVDQAVHSDDDGGGVAVL